MHANGGAKNFFEKKYRRVHDCMLRKLG